MHTCHNDNDGQLNVKIYRYSFKYLIYILVLLVGFISIFNPF